MWRTPDEHGSGQADHEVVAREYRDRVLDWRVELRRLEPDLPRLPAAARRAVLDLVTRFLREDERDAAGSDSPLHDAA